MYNYNIFYDKKQLSLLRIDDYVASSYGWRQNPYSPEYLRNIPSIFICHFRNFR